VWTPARSVLVARFTGHGEGTFAGPLAERVDQIVAATGRLELWVDLEAAPAYDSELRTRMTECLKRHLPRVGSIGVIAASKLFTMGVSVANLALGGIIVSHPDRASFAAALDEVIVKNGGPRAFSDRSGLKRNVA
jgi:hypothetical protein